MASPFSLILLLLSSLSSLVISYFTMDRDIMQKEYAIFRDSSLLLWKRESSHGVGIKGIYEYKDYRFHISQSRTSILFFLHKNLMVGIIIVLVVAEYTIDGF